MRRTHGSIVSIKASTGLFVTAIEGDEGLIVANADEHSPFWLEPLGEGRVRVNAFTNQGKFLKAVNGGGGDLRALVHRPDEDCTFVLEERPDGKEVLRVRDGHFWRCEPDGEIRATGEGTEEEALFVIQRFRPDADAAASDEGSEPLWDDDTHSGMVKRAVELIFGNHLHRRPVAALHLFWRNEAFEKAVLKGLHDADYEREFTGIAWAYHFYHPRTRQTYTGYGENAVSMGNRFANRAISKGMDIYRKYMRRETPTPRELHDCGYDLGVACHFITDLTQPMHASNFTNVFGEWYPVPNLAERRHSGLEAGTEALVRAGYLGDAPSFPYDKFRPDDDGSAADILRRAAEVANATFEAVVRAKMPDRGKGWKDENVRKIADVTIRTVGLHAVAEFLCFFANESSKADPVKPGMLYTIRGRGGRVATRGDDRYVRMDDPRPGDAAQEFFFMANPDGSYRIGCNADRGKRWTLVDVATGLHVIELKGPQEADLTYASFKIVPAGRKGFKIGELTKSEVIAERAGAWDWNDHLHRWEDLDEPTHYVQLTELRPIELEDESSSPGEPGR